MPPGRGAPDRIAAVMLTELARFAPRAWDRPPGDGPPVHAPPVRSARVGPPTLPSNAGKLIRVESIKALAERGASGRVVRTITSHRVLMLCLCGV
jgi:hypothetical protein